MSQLTKKERREWAQLLYTRANLSQKEIASKVGVTEATVSDWKNKFRWDDLRAINTISRPEMIRSWYAQINEINTLIQKREEGQRFANSKESDTLVKLAEAISKMESDLGIADYLNAFTDFLDWLRPQSLEQAQQTSTLFDGFIKSRL